MFNSPPQQIVARKEHVCTWCCEKILPGETYARWASMDIDGATTNKMHLECLASVDAQQSGMWEYCVGDGQGCRPAPGEFGRVLEVTQGGQS